MSMSREKSPTGTPLTPLEKKVYMTLRPLRAKLEGAPLVVAVSGGVDSVALLHVLEKLQSRLGYKIHVAHLDHGVRKTSHLDRRFVAALSKKLSLSFHCRILKASVEARSEDWLRKHRYEFLFELKETLNAGFVVTAHHCDDLLETRLMRLMQGTGPDGLVGMTLTDGRGVLRPFLDFYRDELENYALASGYKWREDHTNRQTDRLRNWIRQKWLKPLKKTHPGGFKNMARSLERVTGAVGERSSVNELLPRTSIDERLVYSYMRYHARRRLTSRDVSEFLKRLKSQKNVFEFRLAGVRWLVNRDSVQIAKES